MRDELTADFRQFYGLDLSCAGRTYDLRTAACLCAQLPSESRVSRARSGDGWSETERLVALVKQAVDVVWWQRTKEGQKRGATPPDVVKSPSERDREREQAATYTQTYMDDVAEALGIPKDRR